jgi:hypothetical protein
MHWLDPDYLPEVSGTVKQFLINLHGEIDGMIFSRGIEVHVPPHLSRKIGKAIALGDKVKVRGVRPRQSDVIAAVAVETRDGSRIVDDGPPDDHKHGPKPKGEGKATDAAGVVERSLHGPKGEVRGVLLEDGTAIRFPKHVAERLGTLTKAGARFAVHGHAVTSKYGSVIAAEEIGATMKSLRKLGPKP